MKKRIVIDCFKLVKGQGKSIGIYNCVKGILKYLAARPHDDLEYIILGNTYNAVDFDIPGMRFIPVTKYDPTSKAHALIWELSLVNPAVKKLNADAVLFPRGFAAASHPVKDIVLIHDLIPLYYKDHYPKALGRVQNEYICRRLEQSARTASHIITVSDFSKNDIVNRFGTDPDKISVIYHGMEESPAFRCNEESDYIIAETSMLPHKNARGILEAYSRYHALCDADSKTPLPLKIVGIDDEFLNDNLKDDKARADIECYRYIESDDELNGMVAGAKLFLFLSETEGFGFPPLEAMQAGVPVVCSNAASLPEVTGNAAVTVEPFDTEGAAAAMCSILEDKEKSKELIRLGKQNVKRFSWEKTAEQYEDVLRTVVFNGV